MKISRKVSEVYPEVRLHGIDLFLDGTFIETNAYPTTIDYSQEHLGINPEDIILDKLLQEIGVRQLDLTFYPNSDKNL